MLYSSVPAHEKRAAFRARLATGELLRLPGAFSPLSARLIERKGANVGLIVTKGTRDVYFIGRGNRPEAYNIFFHRPQPLVPRRRTLEVKERLYASGEVMEEIDLDDVRRQCETLKADGVDAVAVCFLHSYVNPEHERAAGRVIEEVLPRISSMAMGRWFSVDGEAACGSPRRSARGRRRRPGGGAHCRSADPCRDSCRPSSSWQA